MELTNAVFKRSHLACIVQDTQCTSIAGDNKCQDHPPKDALCTETISQMSEEEYEGQLDRPQTSIRKEVSGQLPTQVSHLDGRNVFWQVGEIDWSCGKGCYVEHLLIAYRPHDAIGKR